MTQGMSRRAIVRQFLAGSAAFLALPLSAIVTGPLLARALDPDGRGIVAALLVPVSLANLLLTLGLPEAVNWHVAHQRLSRGDAVRLALLGGIGSGIAGACALVLVGPWLLNGKAGAYLLEYDLLAATLPITLSISALRGIVYGQKGFYYANQEQYVGVCLRLSLLVCLFIFGVLNPTLAVWVTVCSGIVASVSLIPPLLQPRDPITSSARTLDVVRYARSTALGTIGGFLIMRVDQLLVMPIAGAEQLGYYAVAVSLAELPTTAARAIAVLILNSGRDASQFVPQACRLSLVCLVPLCGSAILLAPYLLPLAFGREFAPAVPMAQVLFVGTCANVVEYLLSIGLNSIGCPGRNSLLQMGGSLVSVTLIALAVPSYGGLGAAWATTVTYFIQAAATILMFSNATKTRFSECVRPSAGEILMLCRSYGALPPKAGARRI